MAAHLSREPIAWLWLCTSAAAWPLLAAFSPIGLTTSERSPNGPLYEVAFLSGVVGVALGAGLLVRGRWFLAPLGPGRRLAVEAAGLAAPGYLFPILTLAVAAALGAPISTGLLAASALSLAHLLGLGLILLRAPLGPVATGLCLPVCGWLLPSLLASAAAPGPHMATILDASAYMEQTGPIWPRLVPLVGLVLASAMLLRRPQNSAPPSGG